MRRGRIHAALLTTVCLVFMAGLTAGGQAGTDWLGETPAAPTPSPQPDLVMDAAYRPQDVPPAPYTGRLGDPVRGAPTDPVPEPPQPIDDVNAEVQRLASAATSGPAPAREPTCGYAAPVRQCYVRPVYPVASAAPIASAAPARARVGLFSRWRARRAAVCAPVHAVAPVCATGG